jgi:hypothetical protein
MATQAEDFDSKSDADDWVKWNQERDKQVEFLRTFFRGWYYRRPFFRERLLIVKIHLDSRWNIMV